MTFSAICISILVTQRYSFGTCTVSRVQSPHPVQWNGDQEGICVANWDVPCQRENGHWQPWAQWWSWDLNSIWFNFLSSERQGRLMKYPQIHPVLFLLNQQWNATTRPVCGWRIWIVFQRLAEETSCTFAAMNDASWKKSVVPEVSISDCTPSFRDEMTCSYCI